ncbi:hypothetical protein HDV00_000555 [Rhizophlyctis rosea]|nr:hypothetical protein HDV00_000555 [Rhizophlyctis rosea]
MGKDTDDDATIDGGDHYIETGSTLNADDNYSRAFQQMFYFLPLFDNLIDPRELTKVFSWDSLEFKRALQDNLEGKMKVGRNAMSHRIVPNLKPYIFKQGTKAEGAITQLFVGKMKSYIKCINVDYESSRVEDYYDIQLNVKGMKNLTDSFNDYVNVEMLDGENKYRAEDHGLQDAKKGVIFEAFPSVLHLQLKRFENDIDRDALVKINDRHEFSPVLELDNYLSDDAKSKIAVPQRYHLHGVLVHSDDLSGGRYFALIRPQKNGKWYKFDDDRVVPVLDREVFEDNFGGAVEGTGEAPVERLTNAYMLVYVRECDLDDMLSLVERSDILEHLQKRLEDEKIALEERRKELLKNVKELYEDVLVTGFLYEFPWAEAIHIMKDGTRIAEGVDSRSRFPTTLPNGRGEGIVNIGFTCYMAAVIQLLYHSPFADSVMQADAPGPVTSALRLIFENLRSGQSVDISGLQLLVCDNVRLSTDGGEVIGDQRITDNSDISSMEQDAQELIQIIFEQCNAEHSEATNPVRKHFHWTFHQKYSCAKTSCPYSEIAEEEEHMELLPLTISNGGGGRSADVADLLNDFFEPDTLDRDCKIRACGNKKTNNIRTFKNLPKLFLLHILRFDGRGGVVRKCEDKVDVPTELQLYGAGSVQGVKYNILGLIDHIGPTARSGHYIYYRYNAPSNTWSKYNDDVVTNQCEDPTRGSRQVYLVLYARVDTALDGGVARSEVVKEASTSISPVIPAEEGTDGNEMTTPLATVKQIFNDADRRLKDIGSQLEEVREKVRGGLLKLDEMEEQTRSSQDHEALLRKNRQLEEDVQRMARQIAELRKTEAKVSDGMDSIEGIGVGSGVLDEGDATQATQALNDIPAPQGSHESEQQGGMLGTEGSVGQTMVDQLTNDTRQPTKAAKELRKSVVADPKGLSPTMTRSGRRYGEGVPVTKKTRSKSQKAESPTSPPKAASISDSTPPTEAPVSMHPELTSQPAQSATEEVIASVDVSLDPASAQLALVDPVGDLGGVGNVNGAGEGERLVGIVDGEDGEGGEEGEGEGEEVGGDAE